MAEKSRDKIEKMLDGMTQDELHESMLEIAEKFPDVSAFLSKNEAIKRGNVEQIADEIRAELRNRGFDYHYGRFGRREYEPCYPDFDTICEDLSRLLAGGYCDEVIELAAEAFSDGNECLQELGEDLFDDVAQGMSRCVEIAAQAFGKSSWELYDQIQWFLDRECEDEYSLLGDIWALLDKNEYSQEDWRNFTAAAEDALQTATEGERNRRVRILLEGYRRAGQHDRIIPLLEAEADATWLYIELVDALLANGETERARVWAAKGAERALAAGHMQSYTYHELRDRLREMARERGDGALAASYLASEFREHPSVEKYREIKAAVDDDSVWASVRVTLLQYLKTGDWLATSGSADWPLPPEEYTATRESERSRGAFPDYRTLVDVAAEEGRFDDVVDLYHRHRAEHSGDYRRWSLSDYYFDKGLDIRAAEIVQESHPDISLGIWKKHVDDLIGLVKPRAYEMARPYIVLTREVYKKTGRTPEWDDYLRGLKTQHKAKRKLMEILVKL